MSGSKTFSELPVDLSFDKAVIKWNIKQSQEKDKGIDWDNLNQMET